MPPRPLRPKDEPGTSEGSENVSDSKSAKRRAVSSACIPCRKRKSKCDGNLPSCSTCTAVYRTECYYDAESDHRRKGALRRDIQNLQQQNDALDVIVASLRSLPEDEALALFHNLRNDSDPDALAASLRNDVRLPNNYAPQTLEAEFAQQMSQSTPASTSTDPNSRLSMRSRDPPSDDNIASSDMGMPTEDTSSWFAHPQDPEFVDHLLKLYFTWIHPFYHLFSQDRFLQDLHNNRTDFCSPLLVHAILAFACHYSDRPAARDGSGSSMSAGDYFFAHAKRHLDLLDRSSLTTVQALAVMSIRECSQGRDSSGYQLAGRAVRMALEMGLHLAVSANGLSPAEVEVRKITFWGVFNIETILSVGFGRLSQLPRPAADIAKPIINEQADSVSWQPYEENNYVSSSVGEQVSHPMLFVEHLSRLCELACDMVNTFYAPQERFTSRRLAAAYTQYQQWYRNLPDSFRLENTAMPHVMVLHMFYYACILHLFRPYIKLDLRAATLYPRDTCTFCANEISNIMNSLRSYFSLRRVPFAVASLLLSGSTVHLLNLPAEPAASDISQGLRDLQAMSTNHVFAGRCVDIVRSLANRWNIALPEDAASIPGLQGLEASSNQAPPISQFFVPAIPRQTSAESGAQSSSTGSQHASPFGASPVPSHSSQLQQHHQQQQQYHQQQQQKQQQQQQYQSIYQDPTSPADMQPNMAFWTPFPGQSMPTPASEPTFTATFSQDRRQQQNWMMLNQQGRHHSAPSGTSGSFDENMEGGPQDWTWQ